MEYMVGGGIVGLLIPAFISEGSWSMGTGSSKGGVSLGSSARKVTLSLAGCAVGAFIGYQVGSRLFRNWREFYIITGYPEHFYSTVDFYSMPPMPGLSVNLMRK